MADLAFRDLPGVIVDLAELDEGKHLPDHLLAATYADRGEVWQVVSGEFIRGGRRGTSLIQSRWQQGGQWWQQGRFVIVHSRQDPPLLDDLPPQALCLSVDDHVPTAEIRRRVFEGKEIADLVPEAVHAYIRRYRLFTGVPAPRETRIVWDPVRLRLVLDDHNSLAHGLAQRYHRWQSEPPSAVLVLGGDGTMLAAIRSHWRERVPFVGLNAGTLGFLMNEELPEDLTGLELIVYRIPMLRVEATTPDGRIQTGLAASDAWVERDSGQAAWLELEVDDHVQIPRLVGDGLLVATPAGSSGYARAMGATPVPLTAPVLTLAGSNVFQPYFWKPVALPETARVRIRSLDTEGKRPVRGFLDGHPLGPICSMAVRLSTVAAVELAFTPQYDLSERLLRSLFPTSK
jgi:NAD kinase